MPRNHKKLPPSPQARALIRHREALLAEAARCGLTDVRVFGSVARGDADADSDIDLLVKVRPGATSAFPRFRFRPRAEAILGHDTDVVFDGVLRNPNSRMSQGGVDRDAVSL